MILENSDVCAHCGQPLPGRSVVTPYGERKPNRTGMAITVALHLLLVAVYLFQPKTERHAAPKSGAAVVWLPPLNKPAPKTEQAPKSESRPIDVKLRPPPVVEVPRLPNTITLPNEKPRPVEVKPQPPVKEEPKAPPQDDMAAAIEARRKARGARSPVPSDEAEESAASRGTRAALNNIAAINGRGGRDQDDTGGVFSVTNKTFNSADVKFRGWNQNFKRRWLTAVTVERGSYPDIETAIVKKMIELIRKEKQGDFEWESHRLGKVITMSARPKDEAELTEFLYKEMFPEYKPPRG